MASVCFEFVVYCCLKRSTVLNVLRYRCLWSFYDFVACNFSTMLCVAFGQMFLLIIIVRSLRLACVKVGHPPSKKQNNNKLWMYCAGHAVINGNGKK